MDTDLRLLLFSQSRSDRSEWRLLPTVVFQEFSNEERCNTAKSKLESSLKEAGAKLRSGLEDLVGAAMCSACRCGSHDRWP